MKGCLDSTLFATLSGDICRSYQIDPSWTGLSPVTSASSRMNLYFDITYPLSVQPFSFSSDPVDSPTRCQKTFRWLDSTGQPVSSSNFSVNPPSINASPASVRVSDDQVAYPVQTNFFLQACLLDSSGSILVSSCLKSTLYATLSGDICDSYTIDSSWPSANPFFLGTPSLIDVINKAYTLAPVTYAKNPLHTGSPSCSTTVSVQLSTTGSSWFDESGLMDALNLFPEQLMIKLTGTLLNSKGGVVEQVDLPTQVQLGTLCSILNEL